MLAGSCKCDWCVALLMAFVSASIDNPPPLSPFFSSILQHTTFAQTFTADHALDRPIETLQLPPSFHTRSLLHALPIIRCKLQPTHLQGHRFFVPAPAPAPSAPRRPRIAFLSFLLFPRPKKKSTKALTHSLTGNCKPSNCKPKGNGNEPTALSQY